MDLSNKNLNELREIAKKLEIKNISKFRKAELIDEIRNNSTMFIEKNGVILKEKISQKTCKDEDEIQENKVIYKNNVINKENKCSDKNSDFERRERSEERRVGKECRSR